MYNGIFGKLFKICLPAFLILDILSWIAYRYDGADYSLFFTVSGAVLLLALYKLEWGALALLGELFIGSQGRLLAIQPGISIRMAFFLILLVVWLVKFRNDGSLIFFKKNCQLNWFLFFFIILCLGALNGILNNSLRDLYADLNGWLFFASIPLIYAIVNKKNLKAILSILMSAAFYLSIKTLVILLLYAHDWPVDLTAFYQWFRDVRQGEITHVTANYYRIFMQSQIYVLIGFIISFYLYVSRKNLMLTRKTSGWFLTITLLSSTAVIACLSRSYWVGALTSLFLMFIGLAASKTYSFKKLAGLVFFTISIALLEIGFLYVMTGNLTNSWLSDRWQNPADEPAGISRLSQLSPLWLKTRQNWLLGSGFGQTVTYFSNDPRILAKSPSGEYTTYAFEWGYLDIWLKIGLLGLLSYLLLVYRIIKQGWEYRDNVDNKAIITAFLYGLMALIATSIFSPYLNHPLGIGYLILTGALVNFYYQNKNAKSTDQIGD